MHRLPTEILFYIFKLCLATNYERATYHRGDGYRRLSRWPLLTGLMLVCRLWRELICGTPLLWRELDISQPERSFKLCLARAGKLPLYIMRNTQGWRNTEIENLRTLAPYASRVQGVEFANDDAAMLKEPREIAPFVLDSDLSSLEVLILPVWNAVLPVDRHRFPRLRSLSVAYARGVPGLESHTRLRTLYLSSCTCELSLYALVRVIQQNPELGSLTISSFFRQSPPVQQEDTRPAPHCPLPRLKHLQLLCETSFNISEFLTFFLIPPSATVWLSSDDRMVHPPRDLSGPHEPYIISSMLPGPSLTALIPSIARSTHVSLKVMSDHPSDYRLKNYRHSPQEIAIPTAPGELWIEKSSDLFAHPREVQESIADGLCDLVRIFGSVRGGAAAPLTSLDVLGSGSYTSAKHWWMVFAAFPALEEVMMRGVEATRGLWTALRDVGGPMPLVETRDVREDTRAKASSRLRVVGIYATLKKKHIAGFFEEMLTCFRSRAARGLRLEKLVIGEGFRSLAVAAVPERVLELKELIADGGGIVECDSAITGMYLL